METLYYRMKWGWDVILMTSVTLLLVLGACIACLSSKNGLVIALVLILSLFCSLLYMPYGMGCTENGIYVRRVKGRLWIPFEEIQTLSAVNPADAFLLRVMGSGGFLGYFGWYKSQKLGNFVLYTTQRKRLVLIETARRKYVVGCADPSEFVALCDRLRQSKPS